MRVEIEFDAGDGTWSWSVWTGTEYGPGATGYASYAIAAEAAGEALAEFVGDDNAS